MPDTMQIHQLKVLARIGILPWEKQCQQTLIIDIEYPVNCQQSATRDALETTCDYSQLVKSLTTYLEQHTFGLLETLAENLCQHVLNSFSLAWVKLKICKPSAIFQANYVAISIERAKNA